MAEEYRLAHWAQVMQERQSSGLTTRAYCELEGIHENVYYYWQRKLREAACEQLEQARKTSLPVPGFTEVQVTQTLPGLPESSESGCLRIEVAGLQITADSNYPTAKLAMLLRELNSLC